MLIRNPLQLMYFWALFLIYPVMLTYKEVQSNVGLVAKEKNYRNFPRLYHIVNTSVPPKTSRSWNTTMIPDSTGGRVKLVVENTFLKLFVKSFEQRVKQISIDISRWNIPYSLLKFQLAWRACNQPIAAFVFFILRIKRILSSIRNNLF